MCWTKPSPILNACAAASRIFRSAYAARSAAKAKAKPRNRASRFVAAGPKRQTNVTVSIGVADVAGNRRKPDDLVKAADKALYQAKSYGRNCTVVGDA